MNCKNCNVALDEGVKFCAKCGTTAEAASAPAATNEASAPAPAPAASPPAAPPPVQQAPAPAPYYPPRPPSPLGLAIKESWDDILRNRGLNIWTRAIQLFAWIVLGLGSLLGLISAIRSSMQPIMVGWDVVDRLHAGHFLLHLVMALLISATAFVTLMTIAHISKK